MGPFLLRPPIDWTVSVPSWMVLLAKLRNFLGKGAGGDLQQRLQQLGKTGDEIRLLSEIERIVTAHGLVEFRGRAQHAAGPHGKRGI